MASPSQAAEARAAKATVESVAPAGGPTLLERALRATGGAEEIVFVVRGLYEDGHYYANFGHWSSAPDKMMYAKGGSRLCKLNLRTRQVTVLLDDPQGGFRDPRVHYDGRKLLFSYRPGGTKYFHLYEIHVNGAGLRQLTNGNWDDVEPIYLPQGDIVFISTRCNRFVPCYHTQAGVLYRMAADGSDLRQLSANNVSDHRPAMLPDGRIVYTRWEYVDRAPQKFHSLWTMNPDGTNQMVLLGNTVYPSGEYVVMIDALPIPGTDKIVAAFSPGHGYRENDGDIVVVDSEGGPDDLARTRRISPKANLAREGWAGGRVGYRDPFPLGSNLFLVAHDKSIQIIEAPATPLAAGRVEAIYTAEEMVHDPRVIGPQPRERYIPSRSDPKASTGRLILANVYHGRNMEGVKPGEIKKLLVLEDLPKPVSYYSLQGAISMDGTHTLHRILGTVPVEEDGSAYLEAPALRGLYLIALDEQDLAVKRMQSYLTVMPGETLGCVGCHESRTQTTIPHGPLLAVSRHRGRIEPLADVPEVFDYPRDIQPILDKRCVSCHNTERPEGHVVLTGDRNEWFTQSYYALFAHKQISDSWRYDENGNHGPRQFGSSASQLIKKLDGSHHGVQVSPRERRMMQLWIDTGATFAGTYAAMNTESPAVAGALTNNPKVAIGGPVGEIVQRRCLGCHGSVATLGQRAQKGRVNLPKHCWNLYNLSHPEKSMILRAPLPKNAGGYGWCHAKPDKPATGLFAAPHDPDYQAILRAIQAAQKRQEKANRFDMPGFRPNEHYVRWMKRYGVLPESFNAARDPINVYETDQAYWRSLWYRPGVALTAFSAGEAR